VRNVVGWSKEKINAETGNWTVLCDAATLRRELTE
jgi:hypothetical protein